jgi:Tfp pilus assembly protein PilF
VLYCAREYERATEQLLNTLELDPGYYPAHWWLGWVYGQTGDFARAVAELEQAVALSGDDPGILAQLGRSYAMAGEGDRARAIISELREASKTRYVASASLAAIYVGLGEVELAFECLESAYHDRGVELIYLKVDPRFDALPHGFPLSGAFCASSG